METNKIYLGDCLDGLKSIPDKSIDLILTDPPYNIGGVQSNNIKFKTRKDMNLEIAEWDKGSFEPEKYFLEMKRIIKDDGNIFIFTSHNLFGRWFDMLNTNFDVCNFMVWKKTNPTPQVRKVSFLAACELIITGWNKGHKWNFGKQNDMHNFVQGSICMGNERLEHPTQKPLYVLDKIINIASNVGDVVLDCFLGTGSVAVSALRLNRKFIGFEIDENYYKLAEARLKTEMEKNTIF
jgi:site-specific DNA-methyltransferase (adenine-specific)/modification methylase